MSEQKNIVTFLDGMERTIIGEQVSEDANTVDIQNPVVVNIVPQADPNTGRPTGQMALQLLPVFFREFLGDKEQPVVYSYSKARITPVTFNGGFDFRLYAQYDHIFNPANMPPTEAPVGAPPNAAGNGPVINLFND